MKVAFYFLLFSYSIEQFQYNTNLMTINNNTNVYNFCNFRVLMNVSLLLLLLLFVSQVVCR